MKSVQICSLRHVEHANQEVEKVSSSSLLMARNLIRDGSCSVIAGSCSVFPKLCVQSPKHSQADPSTSINNTNTSIANNIALHPRVRLRRRNILARKVGKEIRRRARKGARAAKPIDLAHPPQVGRTRRIRGSAGASKVLSRSTAVEDGGHVLKNASLDKDVTARVDFKGVA